LVVKGRIALRLGCVFVLSICLSLSYFAAVRVDRNSGKNEIWRLCHLLLNPNTKIFISYKQLQMSGDCI